MIPAVRSRHGSALRRVKRGPGYRLSLLAVPLWVVVAVPAARGVPAGRAALPPLVQRMNRLWPTRQSYRLVTMSRTSSEVAANGVVLPPISDTQVAVVVRHGTAVQSYVVETKIAGPITERSETITAGGQLCTRRDPSGRWSCITAASLPAGASFPLSSLAVTFGQNGLAFGAAISFRPVGTQFIAGQRCAGFQIRPNRPTPTQAQVRQTVWIALSSALPVERVVDIVYPPVSGHKAVTEHLTETWSDWNDAALRVPALPAA